MESADGGIDAMDAMKMTRMSAFLVSLAALGGACVVEEERGPGGESSLQIPLSQPAPDGMSTYFLRDATFHITSDDGTDLLIDGGGDDATVVVPLDPGSYRVRLLDGWRMERVTPGQPAEALSALLASHNPATVYVQAQFPAYASFQFLLGSTEGPLMISFGVSESWLASGNLYVVTNEPQEGSTGAFAGVPVGASIGLALHFPSGQTMTFPMPGGGYARYISMGPLAAAFFGSDVFEDHVGPAFTGTYQNIQVHIDDMGICHVGDAYFFSATGSDSVFYELIVTGGPGCIATVDEDGYPLVDNLQLVPQFELRRYQIGVLTDRLTGTLGLVFTTDLT